MVAIYINEPKASGNTFDVDSATCCFIAEFLKQLAYARYKFPGDNLTMIALMEEVGELAKAVMDEAPENVNLEAIQVATMAARVWLDGDHSIEYRREQNGLEPLGHRE